MVTSGAILAAWETMESDLLGFVFMMMNNLTGGIVTVYFEKYSKQKLVNTYEVNFFYSLVSIIISGSILIVDGRIPQYMELMQDPNFVSFGV